MAGKDRAHTKRLYRRQASRGGEVTGLCIATAKRLWLGSGFGNLPSQRWSLDSLHCNYPHHRDRTVALLGAAPEKGSRCGYRGCTRT